MVLYHHWSSLIWYEKEGFPSNVGLSKKSKITTSATLGLGKNCPHNKRIILFWTKLVVLYHHWSSLIWHEEVDFPSNVGLSKKPKMTISATLGLGKNCPHRWNWGKTKSLVRVSPTDSSNFCTIWGMNSNFYILTATFSNTLSYRFFVLFSISFKYYFFFHSLFVFYHHLFFLYSFPTIIFFNEKCYIYNIFRNSFKRITSKSYVESCY